MTKGFVSLSYSSSTKNTSKNIKGSLRTCFLILSLSRTMHIVEEYLRSEQNTNVFAVTEFSEIHYSSFN